MRNTAQNLARSLNYRLTLAKRRGPDQRQLGDPRRVLVYAKDSIA